jgi:hypothetical protein
MMRSVIAADETQSVNPVYPESLIPFLSIRLFEFAQQLLLQMSPRSFLDRATLSGYPLLLCLPFAARPRFHRLRHVPDPGATRADFSFFWFCVRIHEKA